MPAAPGVALILAAVTGLNAAPADRDAAFARILELEDRRAMGDGGLASFLDPNQPLELRVRAALAIGRIGTPAATPYDLIAPLKDPAPELRRMAVFALGEIEDVKGGALLASMLDDPDAEVRMLAAEALVKLKDPAALPSLVPMLADPDARVIGMALRTLWKIDAGPRLPELVGAAAGIYLAGTPDLKRDAMYFLMRAQMAHPEEEDIEPALLLGARDAYPLARSYAARGLSERKGPRATEALLELAAYPDWRVRVNAFNGLRTRPVEDPGESGARWKVYESALAGSDTGVALAALAALETLDSSRALERLVRTLGHPRARFREVALLALAARQKDAALPSLEPLASDPRWSVRARVAEALASIGSSRVQAGLEALAADPDPRVRSASVEAAAKVDQEWAADLVRKAVADADPFVRAAAIAGARWRGPEGAGPGLDELVHAYRRALADVPNDARLAALGAMAKLGTDAARAGIETALEDGDFLVRRRAAELLRDTFRLDRLSRVQGPSPSRTGEEYLEAVRRARRRVTATFQTDAGTIVVELLPADAPLTVDNFVRLARDGRLDGLEFHRVVPNFVIQDGDPRGDGNGGPPWQIRCEINLRRYGEGAVGMALSGKDTGGSQYFMTHSPQPHLDGGYTIFGQVLTGQETVNRMVQGDTIQHVTIEESSPAGAGP